MVALNKSLCPDLGAGGQPEPLAGEGTRPAPGSWGLTSVLNRKANVPLGSALL